MTGGTAGCVVASRLAEADPKLSILVIEQGKNNYNVPEVVHPALFPRNLFLDSKNTLFWKGNKAPQLADREPIVPSGGILGGGSSINWMVYTRAQRSDFDSWNTSGWSADELWGFLKKVCSNLRLRVAFQYRDMIDHVTVRDLPRQGREGAPRFHRPHQHLQWYLPGQTRRE